MDASAVLSAIMYAGLFVVSLALIHIDVVEHRLPNRIVIPTGVTLVVLLGAIAVLDDASGRFASSIAGGVGLGLAYVGMRAITRGAVGGGDVKLAAVIGCFLAWHGWMPLIVGAAAAFVFAGAWTLALIATKRIGLTTPIAFGPWMILGAGAGLAFA